MPIRPLIDRQAASVATPAAAALGVALACGFPTG